ncbi:hypothetical protein SAMN05216276_103333 [Streptosporangium subroseum]|uniref:Uncharacterized protein n=1 Tax=Streptosporangium subroseum TaxID=106412 RepID=A0A239LI09_9ACTN|nr:hypothetical protein [Streptosporangium subroseum]SNT29940.1 hypothetical protein SAMN05216276_103333 [Streptosporangium subroseum]
MISARTEASWDDAIRASHDLVPAGERRQTLIGVPAISVNGHAGQFGPIISEIATGGRAGLLWDAFRMFATEEAFFEIKRVTDRAVPQTF